ncbi:MAG: hypothetical protein C4B59_00285 [Candidatus Methanogaster sp.]|uniref:Uncharacterized protein n=1 Tax=Candidatus Methanogaster sp. TaxID=3386292 RepID=A0AC61L6Z3_9EURY|nr:MAG: hypothetical protein C4B59_00285 [ANME-2 cluster archaeon]
MDRGLKQRLKYILILACVIVSIPAACAQEQVVINSGDWRDVYSGVMYANLRGMPASFITDAPHATAMPNYLDKNRDILLVEAETSPFFANYEGTLTAEGFVVSETYKSPGGIDANLHFIGELPDITNFTVLDDSYGYNAISVAPYAVKSRSWVMFADHENIDEVSGFLDGRTVTNLLIYGRVDRQVNDSLSRYNPEIIDYGDRFDNNIAITKKYQDISEVSQIVFTNGEFIENEIMSGREPVLFIGTNVIPEQTVNYLNGSGIETGVVIGNDLTGAASMITARTGMHVFIKFGQGRGGGGGGAFSLVETLDEFPLPKYDLVMSVISADYNQGTGGLEVVYQNDANIDIFSKSSVSVLVDGTQVATVGNEEAIVIIEGTTSGVSYDCPELAAQPSLETANITVEVYAVFGESPRSLNRLLQQMLGVGIITFVDRSTIDATKVLYTKKTERLAVTITNTGDAPCYVRPDVLLRIGGREQSYGIVDDPLYLPAGGSESPSCRIDMTDADIADNQIVPVHVAYGERDKMLGKSLDDDLPLEIASGIEIVIIAGVAIAIILIAAAILLWRRRKE